MNSRLFITGHCVLNTLYVLNWNRLNFHHDARMALSSEPSERTVEENHRWKCIVRHFKDACWQRDAYRRGFAASCTIGRLWISKSEYQSLDTKVWIPKSGFQSLVSQKNRFELLKIDENSSSFYQMNLSVSSIEKEALQENSQSRTSIWHLQPKHCKF